MLGEYHVLFLKSDTLLSADVFENLRKMCLKIYHLDPEKFLCAPGLAWETALKKTEVKLELLTDIDMLLMVEKGIKGEICHGIHWYAEVNNKCKKDYDKKKNLQILNIEDLVKISWKNYSEECDEGYFLEDDVQYS